MNCTSHPVVSALAIALTIALSAASVHAQSGARTPVSELKPLLILAMEHGVAHGVLTGESAAYMKEKFGTTAALEIDVKQLHALPQPGCSRLQVITRQKQVLDKGSGCIFTASKRRAQEVERHGLIEWSDELRATVKEAMSLKRWAVFGGERLVFGNLAGNRYTRSGWKSNWSRLMNKAQALAEREDIQWMQFSLQDCRPGGVTAKQERGDLDTTDGTMHTDGRMVATVYDWRRVRKSTAAR